MSFPRANTIQLYSERELLLACPGNLTQLFISFLYDSKDPLEILSVEDVMVPGCNLPQLGL